MNPYKTPKSGTDLEKSGMFACKRCGGTVLSHVDRRFPKFSLPRMILDGWIRRVFAYGFGGVYDQCESCGERIFDKPILSAIAAMLLTIMIMGLAWLVGMSVLFLLMN
jgi:DNA-directed RNA polymerase subunit RPC12/RpoP